MSVFMDLNLSSCSDKNRLQDLIQTAAHLGYSTVAINYVFEPTVKRKQEAPVPTPITDLFDQLPIVQGRSRPIRVLNRLTVVLTDNCYFKPSAPEFRVYDLLAVQPTSEKKFHSACTNLDVDIICITVTEKRPFPIKRAPVNVAVERGVVFEISYSAAIRDSTMRRYTITNAVCLMETCKGKNVILSSAAEKPLELRGPYDISNLALLFGMSDADSKEAVSSTCRSAVLHGETRKTASGVIRTVRSYSDSSVQQEAPPAESDAPAAKRAKQDEGAEPQPAH